MDKCLVIGGTIVDILYSIDKLPKSGEDISIYDNEFIVGGCAFNVAIVLKAFNIPFTLFSPIGKGQYADMVSSELKSSDIPIVYKSEKMDNGYCLTLIEKNGERTFLTKDGLECAFEDSWFDSIEPQEYTYAYICGYQVENDDCIVNFLKKHPHLQVVFAPGPRINSIPSKRMQEIFNLNPIIHLNEDELLWYTKEQTTEIGLKELGKKTDNYIILTKGEDGALYHSKTESYNVPSEKINVVDTCGAGDAHIAGFLTAIIKGASVEESLKFANAVSAQVVSKKGSKFIK